MYVANCYVPVRTQHIVHTYINSVIRYGYFVLTGVLPAHVQSCSRISKLATYWHMYQ